MSFYYSECIYKPLGKIHLFLSPVIGRQIPVHCTPVTPSFPVYTVTLSLPLSAGLPDQMHRESQKMCKLDNVSNNQHEDAKMTDVK